MNFHISQLQKLGHVCLILTILFLSACTKEESTALKKGEVTFRGAATKGPLSGATISVYAMDVTGNKTGASLAQTTSVNGSWSLTVSNPNNELLLVESSGGEYIDESDPEPDVTKKRKISLQAGEVLQGILVPGQSTAAVNFFTYTLVENMRKELATSVDLIQAFNRVRSRAFNILGFDPFVEIPTDPILPVATSTVTEKSYALLIGGAAYTINNAAIKTGATQITYPVIDAMIKDFSDCKLDGVINGISVVDLLSFPVDLYDNISINNEIIRFRNNNSEQYVGANLPTWDDVEFCNATPVLSRVLPSHLIDLSFSTGTVTPNFLYGTSNYNVTVPFEVSSISLMPVADTLSSQITVNTNAVISGQTSSPVNLIVGNNTVDIVILAEDGITETTVTVNVNRNDPPVFSSGSNISVQENTTAIGNVLALDNDGGTMVYSIGGGVDASLFTIDSVSGALSFIAPKNFESPVDNDLNNVYLVDIAATDLVNSVGLSMTVTVADINDELPVSANKPVSTSEDMPYAFPLTDFSFSDADSGNTLNQIQITSLETNGNLKVSGVDVLLNQTISFADINAGNFQFIPLLNQSGTGYANFSFKVYDGLNYSLSDYVVTIDVTSVNDIPIASHDIFYSIMDVQTQLPNVLLNDSDVEDGTVTVNSFATSSVNGGTISSPSDGVFIYTPATSFTGSDSFTYTVKDSLNAISSSANVFVNVSVDSDADGISDQQETDIYGTQTANIDSDGDTFTDLHEIIAGTLPLNNASFPTSTIINLSNNTITSSVTWTLAGSPYWVQNSVSINSGGSLTIESGVVVKFDSAQSLSVNSGGSLTANSNFNFPRNIRFTSIENDTIQGDTSGNSGITANPGDWVGLIANAGSITDLNRVHSEFAVVGLDINGSNPTLWNSTISNSANIGVAFRLSSAGDINTVTIDGAGQAAIVVEESVTPTAFTLVTFSNAPTPYWLINHTDVTNTIANYPYTVGTGLGLSFVRLTGTLNAATNNMIPNPIGGSSVWYIPSLLEVSLGAGLSIDTGAIVKVENSTTDINILGTLDLNGQITSFFDDAIGGDSNGDAGTTIAGDYDWGGINYRSTSSGTISLGEIHYAYIPLDIENTEISINGLTITNANQYGMEVYLTGSNSWITNTINNVTIDTTNKYGIYLHSTSTGNLNPSLDNINIMNTGWDAIRIETSGGAGNSLVSIENTSTSAVINGAVGYAAISVSGVGVNPSLNGLILYGGDYSLFFENNATASIQTSILDFATFGGIYITTGANPSFYPGNTISNTVTPVIFNDQGFADPGAGYSSTTFSGLTNPHVELRGIINTPQTLSFEPFGTGSHFIVSSSATIGANLTLSASAFLEVLSGASLEINPSILVVINSNGQIESAAGSNVTIYDGATFKMDSGVYLDMFGNLYVYGGASSKVVFTSLKDDRYLGDTNGDSNGSFPTLGDWGGIMCSSVCDILYSHIRFGTTALNIGGSNGVDILNNLFESNKNAIISNSTGVLDISGNVFANNSSTTDASAIKLINVGAGSKIRHNYFKNNQGNRGGALHIQATTNPQIFNNLFVENTATLGGGAIDFSAIGSATLTNNTITNNKASELAAPGGIYVIDNTSNTGAVALSDNIIWNNQNISGTPGQIDFVVADPTAINDVAANNNLTMDGSLTTFGIANITSATVDFDKHYYLMGSSPAIDAGGVTYTGSLIDTDYGVNGTTSIVALSTDAGTNDLGYHHASGAATPTIAQSIINALTTTPVTATVQKVIFQPMDGASVPLGPLWNVTAVVTAGTGTVGSVIDRGDGFYEVNYTAGTTATTDTLQFTVAGVSKTLDFIIP